MSFNWTKNAESEEISMTGTDGLKYTLVRPRKYYKDYGTINYVYKDIPEKWRLGDNKKVVDGAIELWIQDGNERKINKKGQDITKNYISPMAYAEYIRKYLIENGEGWGINKTYYVVNINSMNPDWKDEYMKLHYVGIKPEETLRKERASKKKKTESSSSSITLPPPPPPPSPPVTVSSISTSNDEFKFIKHPVEKKAEYVLDTKSNKVYTIEDYLKFKAYGERGGFYFNPIGYIVSKNDDKFPGFRDEWPSGSIEKIIDKTGNYTLNDIKYPKGLIALKEGYEVLNTDETEVLEPFEYNKKKYLKSKYTDNEGNYSIFTDEEKPKFIGYMDEDMEIDTQQWEPGYDSEFDERESKYAYPYYYVTTYQVSPEKIEIRQKMHDANEALTQDQRDHGWQAEWNESRKEPYYFNRYHAEDESYESHGTETKLDDGYGTKYEPYDVNSLPNYDGFMGDPLPSNNSKKASIAAPSVTAPSVTDLPAGWTEQFSRTHNRPYWFNTDTGAKSWSKPTSGGKKKRKSKRKLNKKSKRNTRRK